MISAIHGTLEGCGPGWAAVRVGGFALKVFAPGPVLDNLGAVGSSVDLHTHLHLREDVIALYGFATAEELGLFETLITVSGVGPKLALSILSALSPEQVALAIASSNPDVLTTVSGIGKKTAGRIILELKGKVEKQWPVEHVPLLPESSDIVAALTALGYSASEAMKAVSHLPPASGLSLEERVRQALQYLGRE
ncbi:MAG: Holliday junction branch migration protein RuvA [Chloroflexi bacterium]|nr:Holliday junction branch migration protein RuvA [Chloroflexota bacterium]